MAKIEEELNVFVCGNYHLARTSEEVDTLKLIEGVVTGAGHNVINKDLLRAKPITDSSPSGARAKLVSIYRSAIMPTDIGYADLSEPYIDKVNQIAALRDLMNVPTWTSAKVGSKGAKLSDNRIRCLAKEDPWQNKVELAEYIKGCLSLAVNIRAGKRNIPLAPLLFPDSSIPEVTSTVPNLNYSENPLRGHLVTTGKLQVEFDRNRVLCNGLDLKVFKPDFELIRPLAEKLGIVVDYEHIVTSGQSIRTDGSYDVLKSRAVRAYSLLNRRADHRYILSHPNLGYLMAQEEPQVFPAPEIITNGELELDVSNQRIWFMDDWFDTLGQDVFKFLHHMILNKDTGFKAEDIRELIYGNKENTTRTDFALKRLLTIARKLVGDKGLKGKYFYYDKDGYRMNSIP